MNPDKKQKNVFCRQIEKIKEIPLHRLVVETVSLIIVLLGIATSIRMNLVGRSLWWDEAALAQSLTLRDLSNLTAEGLDLIQSAPVGWLYLVKIFTLLFGNTDLVLRIPSMLAYAGVLLLLYLLLKKSFSVRYPITGVAFAASFPLLLQYSNMFKPYMTDAFFCLLVLWLYSRYDRGKIKPLALGIFWAVLVWFSNPVCFVAGGLILADVIYACLHKEVREKGFWKGIKKEILPQRIRSWLAMLLPLGGSFIAYYFYWLRLTAGDERMAGYWREWHFPLFPTSAEALEQIKKLAETLFYPFYRLEYVVMILAVVFALYLFRKEMKLFTGIYLGIFVTVFASGLKMFPVNKRLWLFWYPLLILILAVGVDRLFPAVRKEFSRILGGVLLGCAILNGGIRYYWDAENVYWPGYEVKEEYAYLTQIIEPGEKVYVFAAQGPIFNYYNDYDFEELGDTGCEVMVGEEPLTKKYDCDEDLSYIMDAGRCYVVMGDTWDKKSHTALLFPTLHEAGYFEMIYNEYGTPLWYYCTDIKDTKSAVTYDVVKKEESGQDNVYQVQIQNTGESYLNPEFETLELVAEDGSQRTELPKNIAPGKTVKLNITLPADTQMTFYLENEYEKRIKDAALTLGAEGF